MNQAGIPVRQARGPAPRAASIELPQHQSRPQRDEQERCELDRDEGDHTHIDVANPDVLHRILR